MQMHKRFLCRECHREWVDPREANSSGGTYVNSWPVSITGNPPGENCPTCGSPEVDEVLYKPWMQGLDIPRHPEQGSYTVLPRKKTIATIPGRTGNDSLLIKADVGTAPVPMNITAKPEDSINRRETPLPLFVAAQEDKVSEMFKGMKSD